MIALLPLLGLLAWAFMLMCLTVGPLVIFLRYHAAKNYPASTLSVSILRPLKGVEEGLERNLESSFLQDYPHFELVFSVASEHDPAFPLVNSLIRKYPKVSARLIVGAVDVGPNPKVNNLVRGYEESKADVIWILDSNIYTEKHVLSAAVHYFNNPKIGLVHHVPVAVELKSPGGFMDGIFLSCTHARMYTVINLLGPASCVIGKSNMYRKADMERLGGIKRFGHHMAEDNFIGIHILQLGLKHQIAPDLVFQSIGSVSIRDFLLRRARWVRVRKCIVLAATLVEPITESLMCGYIGSIAFNHYFGVNKLLFQVLNIIMWYCSDMAVARTTYFFRPDLRTWTHVACFSVGWVCREVAALPIYLWAICGNRIKWRNQLYYVHTDGTAHPAQDTQKTK